jgi:hypothetical protein
MTVTNASTRMSRKRLSTRSHQFYLSFDLPDPRHITSFV